MNRNFIAGAIKRPGAFKKKAKKAGFSVSKYATMITKKPAKRSSTLVRQANLAKTLAKLRKK